MKKNVALALVVIMILSLVSCGEVSSPDGEKASSNTSNYSVESISSEDDKTYPTFQEANIYDFVIFGKYEQDNNKYNGAENIEWLVLDKTETEVFLISKYCLKYSRYANDASDWEKSYIRSWLNTDFFDQAFTDPEKRYIVDTQTMPDITDKIFLISSKQANTYFSNNSDRITQATKYAFEEEFSNSKREYDEMKSNGWWLLDKSSNTNEDSVCTVFGDSGEVDTKYGMFPMNDWLLVRPALKISLK